MALLALVANATAGCGPNESGETGVAATESTASPTTLTLGPPVHHLDDLAREPMVVEHPSGALFVAGYGSQVTGTDPRAIPLLWQSTDSGATWDRIDVGTAAEGAIGNSDVDLAVAPDGTLYFVSMGFDRTAMAGTHIAIGTSHDMGATWQWTLLSETHLDDRPWVEVAPDGTAHVIWNDGSGVSHATSSDGGRSWKERERVHPQGGSSHLAIGSGGEIAVRITPVSASGRQVDEGLELIAVSVDGGHSWEKHPAPGEREWDPTFSNPELIPRWVEPLAWIDDALYHLWSEGSDIWLGRSLDRGASWETWMIADEGSAGEATVAFFPYLVAGGEGWLAATWFRGDGETLDAQVALIGVPMVGGGPDVVRAAPLSLESWRESEGGRSVDPGGEYLPVTFLANGDLAVVSPIQNAQSDRFGFTWWTFEVH